MTTAATVAELRVYGLELGLTTDRALLIAEDHNPARRRAMAAEDHQRRRDALALYRQLLIERDGAAPPLARIESRDDLLAELAVLTIA